MGVGSFVELFMQYFAWGMYNVLWDVVVNLGLVYLPFGFYLYDAYTSTREKGSHKMNASRVLAYLKMKIFIGVAVLTLAGVPTVNLNLTEMKFNERQCNVGSLTPTLTQKKPDSTGTGTTYDSILTTTKMGSLTTKAPVAWMAILSVGQAVSDGVGVKVPCTVDLKQVAYKLQLNSIKDPALKQEIADFYHGCYTKARAKFDAEHPASYNNPAKEYVESNDAAWLGSEFFLSEPGYYDTMQAPSAVKGYPFDAAGRDKGWWNGDPASKPTFGRPYCKDWYENSTNGLKKKILANIDPGFLTQAKAQLASISLFGGSQAKAEKTLIRSIVDVSDPETIKPTYKKSDYSATSQSFSNNGVGGIDSFQSSAAAAAAVLGTYEFNQQFYPMMVVLKMALPLVQAFIISGLIMFLPFLLILSNYGVKEVLTMGALMLSIKFWSVIWLIGNWMENSLQEAILPSMTSHWYSAMIPFLHEAASLNDDVLDYVIGAWYIIGPTLLSAVVTIAGYQTGSAIEGGLEKSGGSGQMAGQAGGKMTGGMVKGGSKLLK